MVIGIKDQSTVCVNCLDTVGCTDCENFKGCLSCDYGGELVWCGECEIHYCQGVGDTPDNTSSDTDTDTSDPDTTSSDNDTETNDGGSGSG